MRVFISHPYASNPKENKKRVDKICRELIQQGITPISPLHLFWFLDDDSHREEIMQICKQLILQIANEVWIYGSSDGCLEELEYAKILGKPVKIMY